MELGQAAHEREAKAGAACLPVVAIVDLIERHEDLIELVARNSRTVVANANLEAAIARKPAHDGNAAALRRELHRVGDEIDQDLFERALVGIKRRCRRLDIDSELLPAF